MASFNPETQDVGTQHYIGYSQRARGENIWGTLFEGVVNTADAVVGGMAEKESKDAVNKISNDYFGTKDFSDKFLSKPPQVADNDAAAKDTTTATDANVPNPVKDGVSRIDTLTQAKDAGKLSEKNFAGQLDATIREIKAKYPGYEDYIDKAVSRALNQPTANMLRNAIIDDWNRKASAASDEVKANRRFADDALSNGYISADTYKKIYAGEMNADEILEVKAKAGTLAAKDAKTQSEIRNADLISKNRANGQATVEQEQNAQADATSASVDQLFSNTYYKLAGDTGKDWENFQAKIKKYQSADSAGGTAIDPTEMQDLINTTQTIDATMRKTYANMIGRITDSGKTVREVIGTDRAKKIDDLFEARMEPIKKIMNGDKDALSYLNWNMLLQKADDSSRMSRILQTNIGQINANVGALSKLSNGALNPILLTAAGNEMADGGRSSMKDAQDAIVLGAVSQGIVEGKQVGAQVDDAKKSTDPKTAAAITSDIIDKNTKIILAPTVDDETKAKSFKSMYDPSLLSKMNPQSAQMVYRKLVNPTMAKTIAKLAESDPAIAEQYQQFIMTQGKALRSETEADVQEAITFFDKGNIVVDKDGSFHVRLDPKAFKDPEAALEFLRGGGQVVAGKGGAIRSMSAEDRKQLDLYRSAQKAAGEMNLYLDGIRVWMDARGVKDEQARAATLQQAIGNINFNAPKQDTWIKGFNKALDNFFTINRDTSDTGIGKYTLPDIGLRIGKPGEPALTFAARPAGPTPDEIRAKNRQAELEKNADALKDFKLSNTFEPGTETPVKRSTLMTRLVEEQGLPPVAAAGVVGNLMHESGLKPGAVGDSGSSIGWAQWHADRKDDFKVWAKSNGLDPNTDETNYAYLIHDLETNYPEVLAKLKKAKSHEEASDIFMEEYERPGIKARSSRIGNAKSALDAYQGASQ
jgi:hypothetical protein